MTGSLDDERALALIPALSTVAREWFECYTKREYGDKSITVSALHRYMTGLSRLRQPDTIYLLFPCNFETYASCIQGILEQLVAIKSENTIVAWTILSLGLPRWYNLSLEDLEDDPNQHLAYTRADWEGYKKEVSKIAKHQQEDANVQMRRIIAPYSEAKSANLYVYDNGGDPLELYKARRIIRTLPVCLKVIDELKWTVERRTDETTPLHLIARHDCQKRKCSVGDGKWVSLLDDFKMRFHSRVHTTKNPVAENLRGVFCGFVSLSTPEMRQEYRTVSRYDDVFVASIPGRRPFGIAFYQERRANFSGMRILTIDEINRQLELLESLWARA